MDPVGEGVKGEGGGVLYWNGRAEGRREEGRGQARGGGRVYYHIGTYRERES